MAEEFVDIAEASRRLGISPGELSQLVTGGKLSTVEVEGIPKFRVSDLETFKASQPEPVEEEELVLMPEEEVKAEAPEEVIPLMGETAETELETPPVTEEVTEVVEEVAAVDESLFEGEGLLEVEEPAEEVGSLEAEVAEEEVAEEEVAEPVVPLRETYAVRRGSPALTVMLLISLLLIVISGIVVMNFIKFYTTGGAPQGILEWLTTKIGGVAG